MKKNLYKLIYKTVLLLAGLSATDACEVLKTTDGTPPTPSLGSYLDPSDSTVQQKKNFNPEKKIKDSESETPLMNEKEKPIIIDYRDKNVVLPDSWLASHSPSFPRLDVLLKKIQDQYINQVEGIDLSKNLDLSDPAIQMIHDHFINVQQLKWIDLSSTDIELRGLKLIVDLLNTNSYIRYINVADNPAMSVTSQAYFNTLGKDLLKRLVLVSEEKLYTKTLDLFLSDHPNYQSGLVAELRTSYEDFFDLKFNGQSFRERYLTYDERQDKDGEEATFLGEKMQIMHRFELAREFYLKGIKKRNPDAAYALAKLYSQRHLVDSDHYYHKEHLQQAVNFGHPYARFEYMRLCEEIKEVKNAMSNEKVPSIETKNEKFSDQSAETSSDGPPREEASEH